MKKAVALLLIALLICSNAATVRAEDGASGETVASGSCGDGVTWVLTETEDEEALALTISGEGTMYGYDGSEEPWSEWKNSIVSVTVEDGVEFNNYAFRGMGNLRDVTMPYSISVSKHVIRRVTITGGDNIALAAFTDCRQLESVSIPETVTIINNSAFSGCRSLESITIPGSVTKIGDYVFQDCTGLTELVIPDSVLRIEPSSFTGCVNLTKLTIPYSMGLGGVYPERALLPNLETLVITGGSEIDTVSLENLVNLTSVSIPDTVTTIGQSAFRGCTGLTEISIPEGVTRIRDTAFDGCSGLQNIALPDSMTQINGQAFRGCSGMSHIYIPAGVGTIEGKSYDYSPFCDCSDGLTICCEADSRQDGWKTCWNYISRDKQAKVIYGVTRDEYQREVTGEHTFGDWTVVAEPTYSSAGLKEHTCEVCGITAEEEIPALPRTDISKAAVTGISTKNYTGKDITPSLTVNIGSQTLTEGTDYTLSYKDNKAIGTATVTITGEGVYTGSVSKTFTIGPKNTSISSLGKGKKSFKVKWKKMTAKMALSGGKTAAITGYQIQYSTSSTFASGNKTVTVKGLKKTNRKIKGLKAKTRYYVRIRTYIKVGGKTYCITWSAPKNVKTR